ncbi:Cullin repeat-like-containing domain protein [Favolaschia claudopus]|uniref:Cullin repeat-like-containing domain protein n=1 Tax=Favolaschia claudopus TaxID=2862362 RepID=A0AAV9ZSD2_9AGAR
MTPPHTPRQNSHTTVTTCPPLPSPSPPPMEQKSWKADLEPTITRMLMGPPAYHEYMMAYTTIFNMATLDGNPSSQERQADLYAHAENFFDKYTKQIGSAAPNDIEDVIPYYDLEWDRFSNGAQFVNRLFTYVNRNYVRRTRGQDSIRNLLFQSWKENVFKPLTARLKATNNLDTDHFEHILNLLASDILPSERFKEMRLGVALTAE